MDLKVSPQAIEHKFSEFCRVGKLLSNENILVENEDNIKHASSIYFPKEFFAILKTISIRSGYRLIIVKDNDGSYLICNERLQHTIELYHQGAWRHIAFFNITKAVSYTDAIRMFIELETKHQLNASDMTKSNGYVHTFKFYPKNTPRLFPRL